VTTLALVLGAAIAVAAVILLALPFLREPSTDDDRLETAAEDDNRLLLYEERDRALAALKEVEFDHRTGKLGDEDYRALVGPLRRAAAAALRALDRSAGYGESVSSDRAAAEPVVPEPFPPPDEGTPPTPEPVPEPYPPPDEATPPQPPLVPEPGPQE
jgi:hypothetical protein